MLQTAVHQRPDLSANSQQHIQVVPGVCTLVEYSNGGFGSTSEIFRISPEVEAGLQSW